MRYVTIEDCEHQTVISRSRFFAFAYRVDSEEDVETKLSALRKKFFDATHICYAYNLDGVTSRFSDDGEPSSTAGQPILAAIKDRGLIKTLVAVVRYFGGTKLGVGGLVRAYGGAAADVLDKTKTIVYVLCDVWETKLSFSEFKHIENKLENACVRIEKEYSDCVRLCLYAQPQTDFKTRFTELTNGKAEIIKIKSDFIKEN